MNLANYLAANELTDAAFAERIGRERSFVTRLRTGRATPSLATVAAIQVATNGAVTATDFMPTILPPPPAPGNANHHEVLG
ncbi:helix-turn-helix domain-containing protein [Ancylobacter pratisalsi]|nr:helix-turn-helix transcriptional regulator [Ancylobacter pratisalsi]